MYISKWYYDGTVNRIMADYPNIAEHFYYVFCDQEYVFASYDLKEVKKFIKKIFPRQRENTSKIFFFVRDAVSNIKFSFADIVGID